MLLLHHLPLSLLFLLKRQEEDFKIESKEGKKIIEAKKAELDTRTKDILKQELNLQG